MAQTEVIDVREQFRNERGDYEITGEMIISDVIGAFPKAAQVFMSYGLHCVGCAANAFDTVEGGAKLHGMPQDEIQQMVDETNTMINKKIDIIDVTSKAISKIKELQSEEEGKEDWPLRVKVLSDCCQGFKYDMDFDVQQDDDTVKEFAGLKILIDTQSLPLLKGSTIDYVDSFLGSGFKIDNPNKREGCRCSGH